MDKTEMKMFSKFSWYILLKWALFYAYQFIRVGTKWNWDEVNMEGLLLAAFMLLTLPLVELIVLFFPFHWALKQKGVSTILLLILAFGLEFIIGWYATSERFEVWMAVKIVLSAVLFGLMYRKQLTI